MLERFTAIYGDAVLTRYTYKTLAGMLTFPSSSRTPTFHQTKQYT